MPSEVRKSTDLKMSKKTDGTNNKKYKSAQFVNKDEKKI